MQSVQRLMFLSRSTKARQTLWKIAEARRCLCTNDVTEKSVTKPRLVVDQRTALSNPAKPHQLHIDWDIELQQIIQEEEEEKNRSVLAPVEDESHIYAEPMLRPTFNLAAYVQKSETLQQLLQLGVDLEYLDRKNCGEFIAKLDFKRDIEPHLLVLTQNIGIPIDEMGRYLTKNSHILKESLDDIQTRVNYLHLKKFTRDEIVTIVTRNPNWLNFNTREIDKRLGFFQNDFQLLGHQVRALTVLCPKLITYNLLDVQRMSFSIREECGFEGEDVQQILMKIPKIWMKHRFTVMEKYDYITNVMKIENSQLVMTPYILENRFFRIKERHEFLRKIGRAQYDPKLELYVSLDDLCKGTDEDFASNIAKKPYEEFDRFLRTR